MSNKRRMSGNETRLVIFDAPMFSNGEIPRERLADDSGQGVGITRGLLENVSYLNSIGYGCLGVIPDAFFPKPFSKREELDEAFSQLVIKIVEEFKPEYIAFSLVYGIVEREICVAVKKTKEAFPHKKIVVGGTHATFSPEILLKNGADIVVRGDGESVLEEILGGVPISKIRNIIYKNDDGSIIVNERFFEPSKVLEWPISYDNINIGSMNLANINNTVMRVRGCKYNCSFCLGAPMRGQRVKTASDKRFISEVSNLLQINSEAGLNIPVIVIDDDMFPAGSEKSHIVSTLEMIKKDFPSANYAGQTRITGAYGTENKRILESASNAGVSALFIGVESGSEVILSEMQKKFKLSQVREACRNVVESGIACIAYWIVGHPGSSWEEEMKSMDFMESLLAENLLQDVEIHLYVPIKGTRVFLDPRVRIKIPKEDLPSKYALITESAPPYDLVNLSGETVLSSEQLVELRDMALQRKAKYLGSSTDVIDPQLLR